MTTEERNQLARAIYVKNVMDLTLKFSDKLVEGFEERIFWKNKRELFAGECFNAADDYMRIENSGRY